MHARVIAATNRSVSEAVCLKQLRVDLLYRLAVFHLELPPLRQREQDVHLLAQHFLARLSEARGERKEFSKDSLLYLSQHHWPGNVRELFNTVQRAFILADDELDLRGTATYGPNVHVDGKYPEDMRFRAGMSLAHVERLVIMETLRACNGNKRSAPGIPRNSSSNSGCTHNVTWLWQRAASPSGIVQR